MIENSQSATGDVEVRRPDNFGVAIGDLVAGQPIDGPPRTVIGVVEEIIAPGTPGYVGNHYIVRVADLYPDGEVERARLYGGVGVIALACEPIRCGRCEGTHGSPDRFVDCLTATVQASRTAEALLTDDQRDAILTALTEDEQATIAALAVSEGMRA
jgi:hypothetical protein